MKHLSTGTGLVALAASILGSTIIMRFGPADQAAHAAPPSEAAKAIVAASTAQVTPTIVWYGVAEASGISCFARAWSDGRLEARWAAWSQGGDGCQLVDYSCNRWHVVSDPTQGYSAAADLDFDGKVDGADLGMILAKWGDAPRHDIPPSDCPLALINP
jgi:hypothetical protein